MKIKTYQYGGVYYQPLINQHKWGVSTSGSQASQKSGESDLEDDMMKTIQDVMSTSGLRSDLMIFNNSLKNIFSKQNLWKLQMAETLGGSGFNANKMSIMLGMYADLLTQSKVIQTNYKQYENAQQNLDEKGAWSNIAIDMSGLMWCMDQEGNLVHVSPEDYGKNQDKYQPLTNAQLMDLRANNPLFGSTNSSFGTGGYEAYGQSEGYHMLASVTDVVDDNDIAKQLQTLITNLGTTDLSDYGVKKGSHVSRGLEALSEASADGIYKIKRVFQGGASTYRDEKTGKEYTYQDLTSAINFLSSSLSNRQIAYLKAKGAMTKTFKEDPSAYVQQYILTALNANLDQTYDPQLVENLDPELGGGAGGSSGKDDDMGEITFWTKGSSMESMRAYRMQTATGSTNSIYVYGTQYGQLTDKDGLGIGPMRFDQVAKESLGVGTTDLSRATFGDIPLSANELSKIIYNAENAYRAYLPVDDEGRADIKAAQELMNINKKLNINSSVSGQEWKDYVAQVQAQHPGMEEEDIARMHWQAYLEKRHPDIMRVINDHNNTSDVKWKYNPKTQTIEAVNSQPFLVTTGYTFSSAKRKSDLWTREKMSQIDNSNWLVKIDQTDEGVAKGFGDTMEAIYEAGNKEKGEVTVNIPRGSNKDSKIVKGMIAIPIIDTGVQRGEYHVPAYQKDYMTAQQNTRRLEMEREMQQNEDWGSDGQLSLK